MTAVGIAAGRAMESARADRLFDDPYAQVFVDAIDIAPVERMKEFAGYIALRTRYYDDYLLQASAERDCTQIVLLAVGLDARAYRLTWPAGVKVFELDMEALLRFKRRILAAADATPTCTDHHSIEVDLRTDWSAPLISAGFDPAVRTAWLAEGLLPYLTREENIVLLDRIAQISAPGSELAFDHLNKQNEQRHSPKMASTLNDLDAKWQDTVENSAPWAGLQSQGWDLHDSPTIGGLASRYGRGGALPAEVAELPSGVFQMRTSV